MKTSPRSRASRKTRIALLGACCALISTGLGAIVSDDFENNNPGTAYNDGIQYGDNGGTGFGAITYLEGTGGGLFNSTLAGARALGVFAGAGAGNTQALGRAITAPLQIGTYTLSGRFDVTNAIAFTGFNLKSSLGTTLGTGELLSFGLTPGSGNTVLFIGGSTNQSLDLGVGTLLGVNLDFKIDFNTTAATYSFTAKRTVDASFATPVTGSLKDTNGATAGTGDVAAVGVGTFNTGNNQNVTADNLSVVPEPSTLVLFAAAFGGFAFIRRRRS